MIKRVRKLFSFKFYYIKYFYLLEKYLPEFYQKNIPYGNVRVNYLKKTGKILSYSRPRTINEKLLWLHRYWKNPLIVKCTDKYLMREYIKDCGCDKLLLQLYGVYDNGNEIDFDSLPSSFVLKCNHGCGYNILCKDKSHLDIEKTRKQLNTWLSEKYGEETQESHYSKIVPKIICEEYLEIDSGKSLVDYKIHCINGEPICFLCCSEREPLKHKVVLSSYSLDWQRLSLLKTEGEKDIPKPLHLKEMIEYASILSKPFPYVRIDFYYINNTIYIGELTFTPAANIMSYYKDSTLEMMGDKLVLPEKISEEDSY